MEYPSSYTQRPALPGVQALGPGAPFFFPIIPPPTTTSGPDSPSPPHRAYHQHLRPQSACWERPAPSLSWEIELDVPVAENFPPETDGQQGLGAQSSALKNSVV